MAGEQYQHGNKEFEEAPCVLKHCEYLCVTDLGCVEQRIDAFLQGRV